MTHMQVYRQMFVGLITKKQKSFERRLGAHIEPLLAQIADGLRDSGRSIGECMCVYVYVRICVYVRMCI